MITPEFNDDELIGKWLSINNELSSEEKPLIKDFKGIMDVLEEFWLD